MHNSQPKEIVYEFLSASEQEVVEAFAEANKKQFMTLSPLERHGYSGAKVFLVHFDRKKQSIPFVLKIHDKHEIEKEISAANNVKQYFPDCLSDIKFAFISGYGSLAYMHAGALADNGHEKSCELKDVIYDFSIPIRELSYLIRQVYSKCCKFAHPTAGLIDGVKPYNEYEKYFRNHESKEKIRFALGKRRASSKRPTFQGAKILNPLIALNKGFRKAVTWKLGPIHGDLHTSNVILDAKKEPHLIDFSWADNKSHILKDFVLMENSLRFMLFPDFGNFEDQIKVDEMLLDEEGCNLLKARKYKYKAPKSKKYYDRLASMIKIIRKSARSVAGNKYNFNEYLASQFLVLYGLLKYDDYNFPVALRALGMIADKLSGTIYIRKV